MKLNLAQSLGIDGINVSSNKPKELLFKCWANPYVTGSVRGVREATPGFLKVIPKKKIDNFENLNRYDIEDILHNSKKQVTFPFSILGGAKPRATFPIPGDVGIILDSLTPVTWIDNTTTTELETLDSINLGQIFRGIYDGGPISLTIKSYQKLAENLISLLGAINNSFSYSDILYVKTNRLSSKDMVKNGLPELRCSFFKPSQSIPFFGKNNGGVIHLTITQQKFSSINGRFTPLFEAVGLFTNNVDAVKNVDGCGNYFGVTKPITKLANQINGEACFLFEYLEVKTASNN